MHQQFKPVMGFQSYNWNGDMLTRDIIGGIVKIQPKNGLYTIKKKGERFEFTASDLDELIKKPNGNKIKAQKANRLHGTKGMYA